MRRFGLDDADAEFKLQSTQEKMAHGRIKRELIYPEPTKVYADKPESAVPISSDILKTPKGGLSVWVYLDRFGYGIRDLKTNKNRCIFAHDTNFGKKRRFEDCEYEF